MLTPEEIIRNFSEDSEIPVSIEQVRLALEGYSSEIADNILIVDRHDMAMPIFFNVKPFDIGISREISKFLGENG